MQRPYKKNKRRNYRFIQVALYSQVDVIIGSLSVLLDASVITGLCRARSRRPHWIIDTMALAAWLDWSNCSQFTPPALRRNWTVELSRVGVGRAVWIGHYSLLPCSMTLHYYIANNVTRADQWPSLCNALPVVSHVPAALWSERNGEAQLLYQNKKHLKNVGPIRHCEPPHAHSPDVASGTVARRLRIDVHDNAWHRAQ